MVGELENADLLVELIPATASDDLPDQRTQVDLHDDGRVTVSPAPVYDSLNLEDWATYVTELDAVREAADSLDRGIDQ